MNNKYRRLFVAQTRLMTAEKMKLDRFCQHGEYLAYKISLPNTNDGEFRFVFNVEVENIQYLFTQDTITDELFSQFEEHLSEYLNTLFQRKLEFEKRSEMIESVMEKLTNTLTVEEQRLLAIHIDASTDVVMRTLGVNPETLL